MVSVLLLPEISTQPILSFYGPAISEDDSTRRTCCPGDLWGCIALALRTGTLNYVAAEPTLQLHG